MPALSSFDYAIVRVVPRLPREEFFNAGLILFCPQQQFLKALVYLDARKLQALAPEVPHHEVDRRLVAITRIAAADPSAGPIAHLSQRARFHWLVSPRSTLIQVSPVHCGTCQNPEQTLHRLFHEQVIDHAPQPPHAADSHSPRVD